MDFSLTTLFVATSGTLASSGGTQDLAAGQIGIFRPDYSFATAGNIAAAKYFYIAEGRKENTPSLGSKRSDKISSLKVIDWYKTIAEPTAANEVWTVSNFAINCGQDFNLTIRAHSSYIDTVAFNGLTRTVTVKGPCCNCGSAPCASASGQDIQDLVDKLAAKINAIGPSTVDGSSKLLLSTFFSAYRTGTLANSQLVISANPLTVYGQPCDFAAYPLEFDRTWFRVFTFIGPATTQDFIVNDSCVLPAAAVVTQRSSYAKGSSAEVAQLEKNLYSYQTSAFKHLHRMAGYNGAFESLVANGTFYDLYYIRFHSYDSEEKFYGSAVDMPETVIIAFPTGTGSAFETVLTAALGAPTDKSGTDQTTTTTTSTTSTSTTSTTTLIP